MEITNPAFDYESIGNSYSGIRKADPRIAEAVRQALGNSKTVLNVGAGTGSYEPTDRYVIAVEPSQSMRLQRISMGKSPAINAYGDNLPFDDMSFDATMAMVTIHHWPDIEKGLKELQRVTKDRLVIMTFDPDALDKFWNAEYFAPVIEVEKKRYPTIERIKKSLGGKIEIMEVPIPLDCTDGFQEAFYGRPEAFLKKEVRQCQSAWGFLSDDVEQKLIQSFEEELKSGRWDKKYGHYRTQPTFTCALRLIVATKAPGL